MFSRIISTKVIFLLQTSFLYFSVPSKNGGAGSGTESSSYLQPKNGGAGPDLNRRKEEAKDGVDLQRKDVYDDEEITAIPVIDSGNNISSSS